MLAATLLLLAATALASWWTQRDPAYFCIVSAKAPAGAVTDERAPMSQWQAFPAGVACTWERTDSPGTITRTPTWWLSGLLAGSVAVAVPLLRVSSSGKPVRRGSA